MKFEEFVCFEATIPQLQAKDRDGAITELVAALVNGGKIPPESGKEVTKAVIKRENEASTGMGKGVAVPHVKHTAVKSVVAAVGHSAAGIDFASLDEQPVYSVILLISPVDNPDKPAGDGKHLPSSPEREVPQVPPAMPERGGPQRPAQRGGRKPLVVSADACDIRQPRCADGRRGFGKTGVSDNGGDQECGWSPHAPGHAIRGHGEPV
jgi:mannitol/fructose-specific phosphotransferase system IIA component (Ntr-type)